MARRHRNVRLTRSFVADAQARLAHRPETDTRALFDSDLALADRMEHQDWHVDDEGRAMLVSRAEALGLDVPADRDLDDRFLSLF